MMDDSKRLPDNRSSRLSLWWLGATSAIAAGLWLLATIIAVTTWRSPTGVIAELVALAAVAATVSAVVLGARYATHESATRDRETIAEEIASLRLQVERYRDVSDQTVQLHASLMTIISDNAMKTARILKAVEQIGGYWNGYADCVRDFGGDGSNVIQFPGRGA